MVIRLMAMEPLGRHRAMEMLTALQKLRPPRDNQFFAFLKSHLFVGVSI
jgi:hypothetical protein